MPVVFSNTNKSARSDRQWPLIKRMLALNWRYRRGCLKLIGLQLALQSLTIGALGFFGIGIDYIRAYLTPGMGTEGLPLSSLMPEAWPPMAVIGLLAGLVALAAFARAQLTYFTHVATADLVNRQIVVDLRSRVYAKMQRLSFRFFDANESGSLINRVTSDVQRVRMFIELVVVQSIIVVLTFVVSVTYMVHVHVWLTLACLATTPLIWLLTVWFSKTVNPAYMRTRELMDHAVHRFTENLQGVHVVKCFGLQEQQRRVFAEANRAVAENQQWIFLRSSLFMPSVHMLSHINNIILLGYGGYLAMREGLPIGAGLTVFAGLLRQFAEQVSNVSSIANSMQESLVGAERVFEVLDSPEEISSPPNAVSLPRAEGRVAFENVSFAYEGTSLVLEDVSFEAPAGGCVAIVGATGAGKTTLLSLVPRFYDPHKGRVTIDGRDARAYELDDLRRNVGIVFQESFLFSNTVAANIAFGHPEATREQIEKAARIASAHEFIAAMPEGYDTVLGERGTGLSGGQRQRLAIARAVLLEPAILLLDDPTASIDAETEGEILKAMDQAMRGRTTFVVAHRLSTLRNADKVVVLERGRVAQIGSHDELLRSGGYYQAAVSLQVGDKESRRLVGLKEDGG